MNGLKSLNKGADYPLNPGRPPGRSFLPDQGGAVSFKAVFWILFFAALLYGSYKFAPPYLSFYMLKTDVDEEAKIAHMYSDEDLEKHVLTKAAGWGIQLNHDNIEIVRNGSKITISVHYTDTIDFPGGYTTEIDREISVEKQLKDTSRTLQ